jgi:hypothetical protein
MPKNCTIVNHFGKFQDLILPMGILCSPDIFQENMSTLMQLLEFVRIYIDDLVVIHDTTFENHLHKLEFVLKLISEHDYTYTLKKGPFVLTKSNISDLGLLSLNFNLYQKN